MNGQISIIFFYNQPDTFQAVSMNGSVRLCCAGKFVDNMFDWIVCTGLDAAGTAGFDLFG